MQNMYWTHIVFDVNTLRNPATVRTTCVTALNMVNNYLNETAHLQAELTLRTTWSNTVIRATLSIPIF